MATRTGVIEGAAIKAGLCVKKGTAEKGIVVATEGDQCLGILKGAVIEEESFAVAEHASFAMAGEVCLSIAGATITAGQSLMSTSTGTLKPLGTSVQARAAVALTGANPTENLEVLVVNDRPVA